MPPNPSRFPRPNKRASSNSSLAPLLNLYHHTPTFLPLSTTSLPPHINHAFAPAGGRSPDTFPVPSRPISLIDSAREMSKEAAQVDLKKSLQAPNNLDGMKNYTTIQSAAWFTEGLFTMKKGSKGSAAVEERVKTLKEGWEVSWQKGAEAPMRKRARRVLDVLHGTVAGGQPGELVVKEKAKSISELEYDLAESVREREAAEMEADKEAEEYATTFGSEEDGLREMIDSRP